ncbi:flagellar biosynthetic protein FliR [Alicyclobacillus sp. SP_1]|uniref:flagellar biosynthetic protein FliR n=1 Tax=Alicyclobacillus sp. SP_1 TaxID=2942475 RepID=UPI0021584C90|nr:flagellar biosynthetic protein FliR [Alicyclobacillus sp. SP_1]
MLAYTLTHYPLLLLVILRIAGMIGASPIFSTKSFPTVAKVGLVVMMSLWTVGLVHASVPSPISKPGAFIVLAVVESVTGLFFGFIATMIFSVLTVAGQLIDVQIGFSSAELFNPQMSFVTGLSGTFFNLLFTLYFLGENGLDGLALTAIDSYHLIPIGAFHFPASFASALSSLMDVVMADAVQLAAPVMVALLLTNITFALLTRVVPQMNVYITGLPVQLFVGLAIFAIAMPGMVELFGHIFNTLFADLSIFMHYTG